MSLNRAIGPKCAPDKLTHKPNQTLLRNRTPRQTRVYGTRTPRPLVSCDDFGPAHVILEPRPQAETSMKGYKGSLLVLLSLLSFVRAQQCNGTLAITVDNQNGADTEGCITGTEACESLDFALEALANSSCSSLSLTLMSSERQYELSYKEVNLVGSVVFRSAGGRAFVNCTAPGYDLNTEDNVTAILRITDGEDTLLEGIDFYGCGRPIRFQQVPRLTIRSCSFSDASASALDLFNIWNITISDIEIYNSFTFVLPEELRGNAGGLSIRYSNAPPNASATIRITDCTFAHNRAGSPESLASLDSDDADRLRFQVLNAGRFFQRGGGIGLFILNGSLNTLTRVNLLVERCNFTNNTATVGGGLYIAPFGDNINHRFTVKDCIFVSNNASDLGGGMLVGFPSRFDLPNFITTRVENCTFERNFADTAGGIAIVQAYPQGSGHKVEIVGSRFEENRALRTGAGIQFASHAHLLVFEGGNFFYLVENCTFIRNRGDGALATEYSHTEFRGQNLFQENLGTSTEVSASLVQLSGSLIYINNTVDALRGGTLFINTFGQVKMMKGSSMEFTNNTGRIGAAIVVDVQEYSVPLSDLAGNPQCFLVYEDLQARPDEWENVSIVFQGNVAMVGSVIHASFLNACSWFNNSIETKIFDIEEFLQWRVFNMLQNWNTAHVADGNETYYVQTEAMEVELLNTEIPRRWPGQLVVVPVRILDQYQNPTYAILRLTDERASSLNQSSLGGNTEEDLFAATPDLTPLLPSDSSLRFHVHLPARLNKTFENSAPMNVTFIIDAPYNVRNLNRPVSLTVTLLKCPPGYQLDSEDTDDLECVCVTDPNILQCLEDNGTVVLQEGLWAGRYSGDPSNAIGMVLFPCPQPHCICQRMIAISLTDCLTLFDPEKPDGLCFNGRTGILCGTCRPDLGAGVLSTHCYPPIPYGYLIFLPLIAAQIVVAALIVLIGIRIPATLRGLLFYVQVAPYLTDFFPISFWAAKTFLYCFTSLLAFYFPWDFSMYAGQPSELSYFLTYEILLVVGVTAAICMAIKYRPWRWNGLWTLILLTSGILLHTSFGLLHCVNLPLDSDPPGANSLRWYYNGNLTCFSGYHVPLALLAIAILVAYLAFTILLFIYTIKPDWKHPQKFEDFLEVVHRGYKEKERWYGPFELLRRFVLIMFVVYMPGVSVFPICVVFLLFLIHTYALPYMYWWQNILEMVTFCILLIMLLFRSVAITPGVLGLDGENEVSVPNNNYTMAENLPGIDSLSGFLLFWYYLPLLVTAVAAIVVLLYRLWHGPFGAKLKALQKEAAEADQTNQAEGAASVENTLSFNNSGVELVTFQTLDPDDDGPDTQSRRPTKDDKHRQSTKDNKHRQSTKDDKHRQSTKDDKHRQSTKDDKHRQSTKDDKHRQSTKEVKQSPM